MILKKLYDYTKNSRQLVTELLQERYNREGAEKVITGFSDNRVLLWINDLTKN